MNWKHNIAICIIAGCFFSGCFIKRKKNIIGCYDNGIVCKEGRVIGKVFYDADTSYFKSYFQKIALNDQEILSGDSLIKAYVLSNSKTTEKIGIFFEVYFRQFLVYKDSRSNSVFLDVMYSRYFNDYLTKYWSGVDDGGDNFFHVRLDYSKKQIIEYTVN